MQLNQVKTVLHLLFVNNGYWKLLALVIAVLVYFTIRSDISHMREVSVPVEVNLDNAEDKNVAVSSVEPRSVKVSIRGSYIETSEIAESTLKCVVRARQKSAKDMDMVRIKVKPKHLQGFRDVRIVKIDPEYIDVEFDVSESYTVEVAPPELEGDARGTVKLSYDVTNAVITASRRFLSTLDLENIRIQCEPIDVSDRLESFTTRVRLIPPGDAANVTVDPSEMVVNVYIIAQKATRVIEDVPVIVSHSAGAPNPWSVEPDRVDIEISGRSKLLKKIRFSDLMVSVDGNLPIVPGLTNTVPVITHIRQGLDVGSAKAIPEKINLIPLAIPESTQSDSSAPSDDRKSGK
ncbi:MAG: hypothetical protein R6V06_04795 [Kiritimatiellia bacterium]